MRKDRLPVAPSPADQVYTPSEVADLLVSCSKTHEVTAVVDVCVGEGALLRAAQRRWPSAALIGLDVRPTVVHALKREEPAWILSCGDFLDPRSCAQTRALRSLRDEGMVLVLNPPFSYRGNGGIELEICGQPKLVPPAMAFLLTALEVLPHGAEILALLPASAVRAERLQAIWEWIQSHADVKTCASFSRGSFHKANAHAVAVRILRYGGPPASIEQVAPKSRLPAGSPAAVSIRRGSVRADRVKAGLVKSAQSEGLRYIHTSHLRNGAREADVALPLGAGRVFEGPCVLLPRVGCPDPGKISILPQGTCAILSDCIIGIECSSQPVAEAIRAHILRNWIDVKDRLYSGTCAPYTTIRRVTALVEEALGLMIASDDELGRAS